MTDSNSPLADELFDKLTPQDFAILTEKLGLKTSAATTFLAHALENTLLMDRKQQDYGPGNISEFGLFGVIVRMHDKIKRLTNLMKSRAVCGTVISTIDTPQNEPLEDTLRDISNYGTIGLMLLKNEWPKE